MTLKSIPQFFISIFLISGFQATPSNSEPVAFKTRDGRPLVAFYKPSQRNKPTVVMLHGLASTKEEWLPLTSHLNQKGWGWLIYDARGHGQSSLTKDGKGSPNGFRYFRPPGPGSEWDMMVDDLGSALAYLQKSHRVKRSEIYLAGASLGANVCLKYAALTRSISHLVLLSPGLNYQGLKSDEFISTVTPDSVLIVSSPADKYAYFSSVKLKELAPHVELWTDVNPGHGVQMFDENLLRRIVDWFDRPN